MVGTYFPQENPYNGDLWPQTSKGELTFQPPGKWLAAQRWTEGDNMVLNSHKEV